MLSIDKYGNFMSVIFFFAGSRQCSAMLRRLLCAPAAQQSSASPQEEELGRFRFHFHILSVSSSIYLFIFVAFCFPCRFGLISMQRIILHDPIHGFLKADTMLENIFDAILSLSLLMITGGSGIKRHM